MGAKMVNSKQIDKNRESQEEIMKWLYPDRITAEERGKLRNEYLKEKEADKHEEM